MTVAAVLTDDRPLRLRALEADSITRFDPEALVRRFGRISASPFLAGPDRSFVDLTDGGVAGYVPVGRWAVFATGPATPTGTEDVALAELIDKVRGAGRRPVFAAVADPERFARLGMWCQPIADDPMIDLGQFSLAGKRRASVRHSVTSARRTGLRLVDYGTQHEQACRAVSEEWLPTKRGGEMGFTLGRFDPLAMAGLDCHVVVDGDGEVCGFTTWRTFDDGRAKVLDVMRRRVDAPNPTMDLLIGEALERFQADGVSQVSLGCVPRSHGRLAERAYPTRSLYRFKDKYAPDWQPRHLVVSSRARAGGGLLALGRAYCSGGLRSALRRNG